MNELNLFLFEIWNYFPNNLVWMCLKLAYWFIADQKSSRTSPISLILWYVIVHRRMCDMCSFRRAHTSIYRMKNTHKNQPQKKYL